MCMGYKLPPDYAFSLMFRLRGVGGWLSAYFNHDITSISTTTMGSILNLDSHADIRDDDEYVYLGKCSYYKFFHLDLKCCIFILTFIL